MFAEKILRKHVAIIHAYSMMSALQRKVVNVLLYEAMHNRDQTTQGDSVAVECCMPFSKLSKSVSFNSNNTQYLKEAIDGLASLKIEWNLLKDKAPNDISFLNLRVLHGAPTFYQDGIFNFSFHKLMLDLVGNPPIYGTIDLETQSQYESKYSHSLYENSTRFVNLQKSKVIQLDTFRKLLGVHENIYPTMRELTRNVIKPALEEVNDRAGFVVNIENIKMGRKITGFELFVESKKQNASANNQTTISEKGRAQEAIKLAFGKISDSVLDNVLKGYSEDYILEKVAYTKQHAKKEKTGFYPIPYFISALRDDYKSSEQQVNEEKQPKLSEQDRAWREKLHLLQADLGHWRRHLDYAQAGNNPTLVENAQKIISQCEERLQQHLLEQPTHELEGEAD